MLMPRHYSWDQKSKATRNKDEYGLTGKVSWTGACPFAKQIQCSLGPKDRQVPWSKKYDEEQISKSTKNYQYGVHRPRL